MSRFNVYLTLAVVALAASTPGLAQEHRDRRPAPRAPQRRERPDAPPESERGRGGNLPHVNRGHWYGHPAPNDQRFHQDRPFEHGRFTLGAPSHRYSVRRIDRDARRLWLPGGFGFEIALWDWPIVAPWCWDCGVDFVIYDDPDHDGWYLLYNLSTHQYVHVQYLGS